MADDDRHTPPDLSTDELQALDFFELLRRMECDGHRFGRGGAPGSDPARLGQGIRMSFATQDISDVALVGDGPPRVSVNVLGLLGPEGPLPLHLTRRVLERASNRWFAGDSDGATSDTAFLDLCNALQHRMIAFFWRAWGDTRPEVQIEHGTGGQVSALVRALAGVGLPGTTTGTPARTSSKVKNATSLAALVHGPDRLLGYLKNVTGVSVTLVEFIGAWMQLPERLQSTLGGRHNRLGQTAIVGGRVFERTARAEIKLGPLTLDQYLGYLDIPERRVELRHAIVFASGHGTAFDLRLSLSGDDVPAPTLGSARLGQTIWLGGGDGRSKQDYCSVGFSARADQPKGLAA